MQQPKKPIGLKKTPIMDLKSKIKDIMSNPQSKDVFKDEKGNWYKKYKTGNISINMRLNPSEQKIFKKIGTKK